MKKLTKTLVAIFLIAVLSMTSVTAFASNEGPSPRLSHMSHAGYTFAVKNNVGYIDLTYYGYDSFVRADLNVKVQKRFLMVFWNDVYEWNASSIDIEGDFYHEFPVEKSGMYRAQFTLLITGNDGTVDVIEFDAQDEN